MRNKGLNYLKILLQLWMLFIAAVFMTSADALVLGDIQVNSTLGQALSARIAFVDLGDVDALQLKIRLAGVEDYKKLGLQYPDNHKFIFQVVNEPGAILPFIRISTSYPIDDPFVNLLLEVSSPAGKLIKTYTFLLDPSADFYHASAAQASVVSESQETSPSAKAESGHEVQAARPVKAPVKRKKLHAKKKPVVQVVYTPGSSHMKLAMSLSISSYDPTAGESRDALQEELISKEKSLEDLKLQIGEMQMVIKSLEDKKSLPASSVLQMASSVVQSASSVVAPSPQAVVLPGKVQSGKTWLNELLLFAVLVLGAVVFAGFRKYKRMHAWQHGPFEGLNEEDSPVDETDVKAPLHVKPEATDVTMLYPTIQAPFISGAEAQQTGQLQPLPVPMQFEKVTLPIGEQSIQMPAYTEHAVPPEYELLMQAKQYLRTGNDKLAEDALIQAIQINPKNIFGYQALLSIYESRADTKRFENVAQLLKENGDAAAFEEAAEMGRKLDPDNPLYV